MAQVYNHLGFGNTHVSAVPSIQDLSEYDDDIGSIFDSADDDEDEDCGDDEDEDGGCASGGYASDDGYTDRYIDAEDDYSEDEEDEDVDF